MRDSPDRELLRTILDAAGRVIQEAKHHHAGKGQPLNGPGRLPEGLVRALCELERVTCRE